MNKSTLGVIVGILVIVASIMFLKSGNKARNNEPVSNKQPVSVVGHWRNNTEKVDYIFSERSEHLSIVRESSSSECIYEISKQDDTKSYIEVWFKCPMPDWPGYAEFHEFTFVDSEKFVDTKSIQGIPYRVDGEFIKISSGK